MKCLLVSSSKLEHWALDGATKSRNSSAGTDKVSRSTHSQASGAGSGYGTGGQLASCKGDLRLSDSQSCSGSGAHNFQRRSCGQCAARQGCRLGLQRPERESQSETVLSPLLEHMLFENGWKQTLLTESTWPRRDMRQRPTPRQVDRITRRIVTAAAASSACLKGDVT